MTPQQGNSLSFERFMSDTIAAATNEAVHKVNNFIRKMRIECPVCGARPIAVATYGHEAGFFCNAASCRFEMTAAGLTIDAALVNNTDYEAIGKAISEQLKAHYEATRSKKRYAVALPTE